VNSTTVTSTVRMMPRKVPRSSVSCSGTVTGLRPTQTNRTWLPFCRPHGSRALPMLVCNRVPRLSEVMGAASRLCHADQMW